MESRDNKKWEPIEEDVLKRMFLVNFTYSDMAESLGQQKALSCLA